MIAPLTTRFDLFLTLIDLRFKVLEFARSTGVQGVGSGEYPKFECFALTGSHGIDEMCFVDISV